MTNATKIEPTVNSIEEALQECGVTETTLSPREAEALDREGYVVMPGVIDTRGLECLREAFESGWRDESSARGGSRTVRESGTRHVSDLVNRDRVLAEVFTSPTVLAAIYHVLHCPFRVGQLNGREPLPGYGQQGLHADWTARARGEPFRIVTTIWLLDDFIANNGATRVVPGTHLLLTQPPKSFADPANRHPDQRIITASAGSVLVFNGHLWHSGTRNETDRPRRVLQISFVSRDEVRFPRIQCEWADSVSSVARFFLGE